MAEAMAEVLGMDAVYGCGPAERTGFSRAQSEVGAFLVGKERFPSCRRDAANHGHDLSECYGYGNTLADSWFMALCGHAVAVSPEGALRRHAEKEGWTVVDWRS